jgi:hypothetical protein
VPQRRIVERLQRAVRRCREKGLRRLQDRRVQDGLRAWCSHEQVPRLLQLALCDLLKEGQKPRPVCHWELERVKMAQGWASTWKRRVVFGTSLSPGPPITVRWTWQSSARILLVWNDMNTT